jgi:hypothetical protein
MTTHDVARWFDGLRNWLGDALTKTAASNLREITDVFRELPDKPFKEFVKEVKSVNSSAGSLADDINAYRNGQGGSVDILCARINKLKAPELKQVATVLALPVKRTMTENKSTLCGFVENCKAGAASQGSTAKDPAREIDEGLRDYQELKNTLGAYSIDGLRWRFESFRRFPATVLQQIAQQLGYHFSGSKEEVYKKLLQTLEGLKMSLVHGETIGRM